MATDLDNEIIEGELIDQDSASAARAQQGMMQVRGSYATAVSVQNPRGLNRVTRNLEQESALAGASFYYGWSVGRDRIEGPSIGLAMAAARCWGNCAIEQLPMQETADSWVFTAIFVDLETGFTLSRQFRQSKRWNVAGKHDAERKDDIRFQIGQSKAARNVILKALPEWLIDKAMDAAKAGVREKIESFIKEKGFPAAVDALVKALAKVGVTDAAIVDKFGIATVDGLDVDHLVILKGDLLAIQNGQERAEALFPALAPKADGKATRSKLNDKLAPPEPQPSGDKAGVPTEAQFADLYKLLLNNLEASDTLGKVEDSRKWAKAQYGKFEESQLVEIDMECDQARDRIKAGRGGKSQGDLLGQ